MSKHAKKRKTRTTAPQKGGFTLKRKYFAELWKKGTALLDKRKQT